MGLGLFEERTASQKLAEDAYVDKEGLFRWKTNNSIPFADLLEEAGLSETNIARHVAARQEETEAFLQEYAKRQASRSPEQIEEERAEARAAHGPGVTLVNVLTGERYTT